MRDIEKRRATDRARYAKKKEDILSARRARRAADPQKHRDYINDWRNKNQERVRAKDRERYSRNREAIAAYKKAWREARIELAREQERSSKRATRNPQQERAWRKSNPDKVRNYCRRRRAKVAKADGVFTEDDLVRIRSAQRDRCAYCRHKLYGGGELDHIIPLSSGGANWPANLQWLCKTCNVRKNARAAMAFARDIGLLL